MKHVGIIGGGVIGLSTAYYLKKSGHRVTIIDQGSFDQGCSFGNAGMIVPSHFIPLASPGMIAKGIRWMFDSTSPFYIKPRWNRELISWGYQFYRHANKKHLGRAIPALKNLSLLSKSLYQVWSKELPFSFGYSERGLLMMYQTAETAHEEQETVAMANQIGVDASILSVDEVQKLEPDVRVHCRGAVYFPGDAHLSPQTLMSGLIQFLKDQDVQFHSHTLLTDFVTREEAVQAVITNQGRFEFDEVVIATGSWSGRVASKLELSLPMQAGKGYSFTLHSQQKNVCIPSILLEARVAVTPMGTQLRFGGTMEISGNDTSIQMNRVKGIVNAIPKYYPEFQLTMPSPQQVWHGLRPCSPDGLPYIGRSSHWRNVVFATGHAMMGLSLAPATGSLVNEIIAGKKPSIDIGAFYPERYN
jgi:D-amino-acid dehydrogenase